jgi:Raf kinase inhibitor-like YbhB/YbcL family protein
VPPGTKSLALIVDDPDAPDPAKPKRIWVHWVLYDIPPSVSGLPRAASSGDLPPGAIAGSNEEGDREYTGPCPPIGRHRYFFRLYALDTTLGDRGGLSRKELDAAMAGHIIEEAFVMGTYQQKGS